MKIAVLSDIHGNYEALQTCIQYALERGAEAFIQPSLPISLIGRLSRPTY